MTPRDYLRRQHEARLLAARRPDWRLAVRDELRGAGILLGHVRGQPVRLPFEELFRHALVLGGSGTGKTRFLTALLGGIALADATLVIIDGKGDLAEAFLRAAVALGKRPEQVVVVDPTCTTHAVGLNMLEVPQGWNAENHARRTHEALKKLNREGQGPKPWLDRFMPVALTLLVKAGMTLHELANVVSTDDPSFREAILAVHRHELRPIYETEWRQLMQVGPREAAARLEVVYTRGSWIQSSPALVPIIGQHDTINWAQLLNTPGNIIIFNLGPSSHLDEEQSRLIGIGAVQRVIAEMRERHDVPPRERQPVVVCIDEADHFVDRSLCVAFDKMRSFRCGWVLSVQTLYQLMKEDEAVYRSVLASAHLKACFASAYDDVAELAKEFFDLDPWALKEERFETRYDMPEEVRRVVEASGESWSSSEAEADSWSHAEGEAAGWATSEGSGSGESVGEASGFSSGWSAGGGTSAGDSWSQEVGLHDPFNLMATQGHMSGASSFDAASQALSQGTNQGRSSFNSSSSSESRSRHEMNAEGGSRVKGSAEGGSRSRSIVPMVMNRAREMLTAREFLSVDEQREMLLRELKRQPVQSLAVSLGRAPPLFIKAPTMRDIEVRGADLDAFLEAVRDLHGRPLDEVLTEIYQRVPRFIEAYRVRLRVERAARREALVAEVPTDDSGFDEREFMRPLPLRDVER